MNVVQLLHLCHAVAFIHLSLQLTTATERAPSGEKLNSVFITRIDAPDGC